MFKCLEKMNYSVEYIQFIKIVHQETYSQVQSNGYLSECIKLERGVKQGCPLSFPLYCTQNNVFTNIVNKDENIKNFTIFHNNRVVHNNSKFPIKWNIKDYKSFTSISIMAWE